MLKFIDQIQLKDSIKLIMNKLLKFSRKNVNNNGHKYPEKIDDNRSDNNLENSKLVLIFQCLLTLNNDA